MRHGDAVRRKALELFKKTRGAKEASRQIGISRNTLQMWLYTYEALGEEALFVTAHKKYDFETKLSAVKDRIAGKLTVPEILQKYGLKRRTQLDDWTRKYKESGEDALMPKKRGRKTNAFIAEHATEEERLRARILELELELEIQKRINALADEEDLR